MHCEFKYTANAFQDESWDLSNSKGYEHSFILNLSTIKLLGKDNFAKSVFCTKDFYSYDFMIFYYFRK